MINKAKQLIKIRRWILFFVFALIISGLTAFPIETELKHLLECCIPEGNILSNWLSKMYQGIKSMNANYPELAYGFDWLAFAHIVIGLAFIGPYRAPVKNIWIIDWAILACIGVIPLALIAGPIRSIPFWWILIDCSFGVFGIFPLLRVRYLIKQLEKLN